MHIHVLSPDGEAKYWIEPEITLEGNHGFSGQDLRKIHNIIKEHHDVIHRAWTEHFGD